MGSLLVLLRGSHANGESDAYYKRQYQNNILQLQRLENARPPSSPTRLAAKPQPGSDESDLHTLVMNHQDTIEHNTYILGAACRLPYRNFKCCS